MHYSVMYRTASGLNIKLKQIYRSIDDAIEGVLDSHPWLSEGDWQKSENHCIFDLSDGSCFVVYEDS